MELAPWYCEHLEANISKVAITPVSTPREKLLNAVRFACSFFTVIARFFLGRDDQVISSVCAQSVEKFDPNILHKRVYPSNLGIVVPLENVPEPVCQQQTTHSPAVVEGEKEPSFRFLGA
nr:hypothetical protein [Limnobacter sp. P1]